MSVYNYFSNIDQLKIDKGSFSKKEIDFSLLSEMLDNEAMINRSGEFRENRVGKLV